MKHIIVRSYPERFQYPGYKVHGIQEKHRRFYAPGDLVSEAPADPA